MLLVTFRVQEDKVEERVQHLEHRPLDAGDHKKWYTVKNGYRNMTGNNNLLKS